MGRRVRANGPGRGRLRIAADDVHVDVAALASQFVDQRAAEEFLPARLLRLAGHDSRDVPAAGVMDQFVGDAGAAEGGRFAAELLDQPQGLQQLLAGGG